MAPVAQLASFLKGCREQSASILGMLVALVLSLAVALILGVVAYALSQPDALSMRFAERQRAIFQPPRQQSSYSFQSWDSYT